MSYNLFNSCLCIRTFAFYWFYHENFSSFTSAMHADTDWPVPVHECKISLLQYFIYILAIMYLSKEAFSKRSAHISG